MDLGDVLVKCLRSLQGTGAVIWARQRRLPPSPLSSGTRERGFFTSSSSK